jgi:hypothetical protein
MSNAPVARHRSIVLIDDDIVTNRARHNISYEWGTPGDESSIYATHEIIESSAGNEVHFKNQVMDDMVVPRYKTRSAKGEIFNNALEVSSEELIDQKCFFRSARLYGVSPTSDPENFLMDVGYYWEGDYPSSVFTQKSPYELTFDGVPDIDVAQMQQLAVTRSFANIDFSEANLLETLGEMDETVRFMRHTFVKAIRIFRAVKRWDLKYLRREISLKELRDRYMECRYAIRPLIYDVKRTSAAITAGTLLSNRFTFRASETETDSFSEDVGGYSSFDFVKKSSKTVNVRAGVLVAMEDLSTLTIWGIDRPIEAMWELTPFSFIADWFFNIGHTISSFTPKPGVKNLASWVTVEEIDHCEIRSDWSSGSNSSSGYSYPVDFGTRINNVLVSRTVRKFTRVPSPNRSLLPTLSVRLSAFKLLDLAIIGKTLFSKKRDKSLKMAMYRRS